jgi:hypothetical protein
MNTILFRYAWIGLVCVGVMIDAGYAQEPKQSGRPPDAKTGAVEVVPQEPAPPAETPAGSAKLILTGEAARQVLDLVGSKVNAADAVAGQELGVVKGVLLLPGAGHAPAVAPPVGEVQVLPGPGAPPPTGPDVVAVSVRVRVLAAAPVRSCAAASRTAGALTPTVPVVPQPPVGPSPCRQLSSRTLGITLEAAPCAATSARVLGTVLVPVQPRVGPLCHSTNEVFVSPHVFGTSALYSDEALLAELHLRRQLASARIGVYPADGSAGARTWKTETYRGTAMTPYFFKQEQPGENWLWFRDLEKEQDLRRRTASRTTTRVMHSW